MELLDELIDRLDGDGLRAGPEVGHRGGRTLARRFGCRKAKPPMRNRLVRAEASPGVQIGPLPDTDGVDRERPRAGQHERHGHRQVAQVALEAVALPGHVEPVHEEAVVDVHQEDRAGHDRGDPEGGEAREAAEEHAHAAEELRRDHEHGQGRWHALLGECLDRTAEPRATPPAEHLLRPVREEDRPQREPYEERSQACHACLLRRSGRDHAARYLALLHGGERVVHLGDLVAAGDELVELELACAVEVDQARDVARHLGGAVPARAAERHPVEDHVVLRLDALDAGADLIDDARALVAEHAGERHGEVSGDGVQVAVAHAARAEPDEDLAVARVADGERLDRERLTDGVQDGGLGARHGGTSSGWRTITAAVPSGARGPCRHERTCHPIDARPLGQVLRGRAHMPGPPGFSGPEGPPWRRPGTSARRGYWTGWVLVDRRVAVRWVWLRRWTRLDGMR